MNESFCETIKLETEDGVVLCGDHYVPQIPEAPTVLLLHMMPADRRSWRSFARFLQERGFGVLAIDLRGHGESVNTNDGRKLDYKKFSDADHMRSLEDVRAAVRWLKNLGSRMLHVVGASIGANLALVYAAEDVEVRSAILLSAGINYRGVETLPAARSLAGHADLKIFTVAALDDHNVMGAARMAEEIFAALPLPPERKKLKIFDIGGHGTEILETHTDFWHELAAFLASGGKPEEKLK